MARTNRKAICKTCKWWNYDKRHMVDDEGFCHRYPPTNTWSDNPDTFFFGWKAGWPEVSALDWCGEWSKK